MRFLAASLVGILLMIGTPVMQAQAKPVIPCDGRRVRHIVPRLGAVEVRHRVRKLLLPCAVARFPVSGGLPMADCVIDRESNYWVWAKNPSSSATGLFQVLDSTWTSWFHAYDKVRHWIKRATPNVPLLDKRLVGYANVMLSIRAAHDSWAPWGGYC